jgi:hypothetical protein
MSRKGHFPGGHQFELRETTASPTDVPRLEPFGSLQRTKNQGYSRLATRANGNDGGNKCDL